ncbi:MAG: hypothetical protein WCS54_05165 [Fibrobacteraceae bacterium]
MNDLSAIYQILKELPEKDRDALFARFGVKDSEKVSLKGAKNEDGLISACFDGGKNGFARTGDVKSSRATAPAGLGGAD